VRPKKIFTAMQHSYSQILRLLERILLPH
jgi:hypothetical protein